MKYYYELLESSMSKMSKDDLDKAQKHFKKHYLFHQRLYTYTSVIEDIQDEILKIYDVYIFPSDEDIRQALLE